MSLDLSIVVAMAADGAIGLRNNLPWPRCGADMARFQSLTMGKVVVMGRRTWESIGAKPLRGRPNIVLTSSSLGVGGAPGTVVARRSFKDIVQEAEEAGVQELMIIGGRGVYEEALPLTRTMHLTRVYGKFTADVFFPPWDKSEWETTSYQLLRNLGDFPCEMGFETITRKNPVLAKRST